MSSHPVDAWFPADDATATCNGISPHVVDLICRQISLTYPVRAHRHNLYLIAFVLAGSGQHEDENGRLPIFAGDVCVVVPDRWHGYPRVNGALTVLNVVLTASYLNDCTPLLGKNAWPGLTSGNRHSPFPGNVPPAHLRLSPHELDRFEPLLLALNEECKDLRASTSPGVRAGLLLQILGMLDRSCRNRGRRDSDEAAADDGGILSAIRYLEQRYMGPLAIEELAQQTGYTPTYLTRKFRQRLGMSPSEYLLNLRIQNACLLLRDTRFSISAIACDVGFRDSQYFATRFHHVMGMTPSAFRARSRADSRTP